MYKDIMTSCRLGITHDLSLSDIGNSTLNQKQIMQIFYALGLVYNYDRAKALGMKNPPHAVLPNGNHTDFYLWHQALFHNSQITEILAVQLCKKLSLTSELMKMSKRERYLSRVRDLYIVGPSYGSTLLIAAVAKICACWQGVTCKVVQKDQAWQSLPIPKHSSVQLVDDVIYSTTADSLMATKNAVKEIPTSKMFKISRQIGVIINCSGKTEIGNFRIKSLVNLMPPEVWQPKDCPLCAEHSRPLSIENKWAKLASTCWLEP